MEQAPVGFRKALEEFADLQVIGGHGADQGHQLVTNIFSDRLLVHLGGEVVTALRGIFVQRALEEIQRLVDLALELLLAELKEFGLFAHRYAYIYAYFRGCKSASQGAEIKFRTKKGRWELNFYLHWLHYIGVTSNHLTIAIS